MKVHAGTRHTAVLEIEDIERRIFRGLFTDVTKLLTDGEKAADDLEAMVGLASGERPTDPAVLRLLPDASADDPEVSTEFRRLTEHDIRESKLANLRTALFTLGRTGRVELDKDQTQAWSMALNDVRLVLATRLGIATDADMEELNADNDNLDEATAMSVQVYDFLTWAQEHITSILMDTLPNNTAHTEESDE